MIYELFVFTSNKIAMHEKGMEMRILGCVDLTFMYSYVLTFENVVEVCECFSR